MKILRSPWLPVVGVACSLLPLSDDVMVFIYIFWIFVTGMATGQLISDWHKEGA